MEGEGVFVALCAAVFVINYVAWFLCLMFHIAVLVAFVRLDSCGMQEKDGMVRRFARDADAWSVGKSICADVLQIILSQMALEGIYEDKYRLLYTWVEVKCTFLVIFFVQLAWDTYMEHITKYDYYLIVVDFAFLNMVYMCAQVMEED